MSSLFNDLYHEVARPVQEFIHGAPEPARVEYPLVIQNDLNETVITWEFYAFTKVTAIPVGASSPFGSQEYPEFNQVQQMTSYLIWSERVPGITTRMRLVTMPEDGSPSRTFNITGIDDRTNRFDQIGLLCRLPVEADDDE